MKYLNELKPLSIKRITELAEGNHAVVGDLERLAITALCFFDENKSTVKAFQSVGFCLLEREQELEAMQQRAEAAEAKLVLVREQRDSELNRNTDLEAKLAELAKQEPVADVVPWNHPNEERTCDVWLRKFDLKPGELFYRPAPAADLAELVPGNDLMRVLSFAKFVIKCVRKNGEYAPLSSQEPDEIDAILRNIEEAK